MFGHQNNDDEHHHHDDEQPMGDVLNHDAVDGVLHDDEQSAAPVTGDGGSFNPALPASDADQPAPATDSVTNDAPVADSLTSPVAVTPTESAHEAPKTVPGSEALLSIKQQALTQLSPLVDHLDQAPEEKFRTTMMMIQASDNKDLIQNAYDAAQAIPDEKVKAQALLDIVNEINYFTQQSGN